MPASPSIRNWLTAVLRSDVTPLPAGHPSTRQIIDVANREGVTPLIGQTIIEHGGHDLHRELVTALQQHALLSAAHELAVKHELDTTLAGITGEMDFLLLKGTPLAYSLYPEPWLRPRSDTDILFRSAEDADKAWQTFQRQGYLRPNAISGQYVSHEFYCTRENNNGVSCMIDLHWRLSNAHVFAHVFDFDELKNSAIGIEELAGSLALDPVHALLHACIHRIAHRPEGLHNRLIWLYDIHLLARTFNEGQWERLVALATEKSLCGITLDGLTISNKELGTPLPEEVSSELVQASRHESTAATIGRTRLSMELAGLRALPNWRMRIGLVREHLFPNADYMLEKYQPSSKATLPLLYLRRIIKGTINLLK